MFSHKAIVLLRWMVTVTVERETETETEIASSRKHLFRVALQACTDKIQTKQPSVPVAVAPGNSDV